MAYTEFYCQTTASNLNAGSTTADAAAFTYASGTWVQSTGIFTVASGNPSSDGVAVGDFASVYADGATVTGFVGRVTARDAATITVSLTVKAGTAPTDGVVNRTLKIGGAWKGPNAAEAFPFAFVDPALKNTSSDVPRVNFKGGTNYAVTAAITHAGNGPIVFQGYTTSVGDGGKFTMDGGTSGASYVPLTTSGDNITVEDFILANNGATGTADGLNISGSDATIRRVVVHDIRGDGIVLASTSIVAAVECETYACNKATTAGDGGWKISGSQTLIRCMSHDNTGTSNHGFVTSANLCDFTDCSADTNGGQGFRSTGRVTVLKGCDVYNNGSDGIGFPSGTVQLYIENTNLVKNTGHGINLSGATANGLIQNCGFGAGTQANSSQINAAVGVTVAGSVTYANDVTPWTDPANGDFRISLAAAKGAGRGSFTQTAASYAGTVGYPDIGAAQHQESGGGGSSNKLRGKVS